MKNFLRSVYGLSNVKRFTAHRMLHEYNVAEHSFRVAILAMVIADDSEEHVEFESVLARALLHDFEEAALGDMPGPIKRLNPEFKETYDSLGSELMADYALKGLSDHHRRQYLREWEQAKKGPEGFIVAIADKLESVITLYQEVRSGNRLFEDVLASELRWFEQNEEQILNEHPIVLEILETAKGGLDFV